MKKKILTRANALIVMLLSALGFAACEPMEKYGVPDVPQVPSTSIVEENL